MYTLCTVAVIIFIRRISTVIILSTYVLSCISVNSQMKAVAGLKMAYQVQQAINGSKGTVVRGFRHDDSDSALCSHLYSMVRGNRQHRRAFLISLLNLFDDNSVSSPLSFRFILFSVCLSAGFIAGPEQLI